MDRGANGGVAGSDTRVISQTGRTVIITGIEPTSDGLAKKLKGIAW